PCGCSPIQYGGLVRRYNFLQSLRDKGWKILPIELGDLGPHSDPTAVHHKQPVPAEQVQLKYRTMVHALSAMDSPMMGMGETDFQLDLFTLLGTLKNEPFKMPTPICSSLDFKNNGAWEALGVKPRQVLEVMGRSGKLKIGVTSALGLAMQQEF